MEYSQFERHPAHARDDERRIGDDRRDALRRRTDRGERLREIIAFATAMCGGLAVLYFFFVAIGTIDMGDAIVATVCAIILALIWVVSFWWRMRTGGAMLQRPDRERRGF